MLPRLRPLVLLATVFGGSVGLVGCADPDSAVGFQEASPAARMRAIRQAAERNDKSAIPDLIGVLASDDPAERFFSIPTLERMTGQTFGYDHAAEPAARREAVKRWTDWYAEQNNGARTKP